MKVAAIIAEYNPFHNGHQYQIEETKRITGADYIIVVMSGNFVQRGAPALCNKYIRTQMALAGGADIVLELPALYATSSAEYFAQAGVTLLNKLGVIDFLSFGSEYGDIATIKECARQLIFPTPKQETLISTYTSMGLSYPAARQQMLLETIYPDKTDKNYSVYTQLLSSPNNILGLEYCKALISSNSSIEPVTILRTGGYYHETDINKDIKHFASASAIRNALKENSEEYFFHLPEDVLHIFRENNISQCYITEDDFSSLLFYKLLAEENNGFAGYLDCTQDLSDKINKHLSDYQYFTQFCTLLKSKDLTYTRISRVLFHILLNQKTPDAYKIPLNKRNLFIPYARLLGFRKEASLVLSAIKRNSSIPLIGNIADATNYLTDQGLSMLNQDIYTCNIYEIISSQKSNKKPINEYKQSPIIL